ncbi:DEAD/DEAH box helicase family protein [Mycoplasma sp. CSL7491-lung]|uniref:DEAD/DEAH box helicase family protein n=4 Tax=unclassified Mycoplasma TaxID=2683645 RepID=UPI001C115A9C|nr:DEAD/DEAH box helicase family protein [Mycoplasma sp. CSL7491-lung]MBU4692712.1 DEAD/DEAH box helicase family protein [Mycoplasma sp. CSL7491-lung]
MELTKTQNRAVSQLLEHFNNSYSLKQSKIVEFKAPTGSGKTFMIANFIDKAITINKQRDNKPIIFVVMTLSNAELPKQMEDNFNEYKFYLENRNDLIFERKESPSSSKNNVKDADYTFKVETNKVFVLGASSFGANRIYTEQGILDKFISEISNNYFVVFIRDEAHIGTSESGIKGKNKQAVENFYEKMSKASNFQINMTATPKGIYEQVKISEKELKEDDIKLLKINGHLNEGLSEINSEQLSDLELLDVACAKFKEIKQKYITEEGLIDNINPAMLIQVNDKKANDKDFDEKIENIIKTLKKHNLTWAKYFSSEKIDSNMRGNISLKNISKRSSDIDVIIFKVGPATGWNIPRACMLVQLRNVSSDSLSIQTIGRIKRNPNPSFKFDDNSTAYSYWVYSNIENIDKIDKDREFSSYKLNKESLNDKFYYGEINKEVEKIKVDLSDQIVEVIKNNKNQLLSNYNYYLNDYQKEGYIPYKEEKIIDKEKNQELQYINRKINNIIEMSQFINEFNTKTSNILDKKDLRAIDQYFINDYKDHIHSLLWYSFIKFIYPKVKKYVLDQRKRQINELNIREFKLMYDKQLPSDINFEIIDEDFKIEFEEQKINYQYELISLLNNKSKQRLHYYDSNNERSFINSIVQLFKDDLKNNNYKNISLFRNPVQNGIFYEYYDEDSNIKRQFPDFVLVYKTDKIEHQINVEIKDFNNDYDEIKTSKIIDSYQGYYEDKNNNLMQIVTSLLIQVDKSNVGSNKFIIAGGGSTNHTIEKTIKENIGTNQIISWIYNLAKDI